MTIFLFVYLGLPIKPLINVKTESLDYDDDYYMDSIDDTLCSPGENIAEMSSEGVEVKNGPPTMFNQRKSYALSFFVNYLIVIQIIP